MNFSSKSTRSWSSNGATDNLDCRTLSKDCTEIQSPPPSKSLQRHHQPPESGLMKEDDMSSWFYYLLDDPFFDRDLPGVPDPPPPPDGRALPKPADFSPAFQSNQHYSYNQSTPQSVNFSNFAPSRSRFPESGSSATSRNNGLRESESWLSPVVSGGGTLAAGVGGCCTTLSNESDTCELILTSLSGDTASEDPVSRSTAGDRKRKGKELANDAISEYHSEDVKIESSESKKESSAQGSAKRSRAAEIRNLSVRRRRNRINEKMRALQELVPRCGKTDKASMLDEAIEYFKSLQLQVQMMSMGCGMVPMMVLGVQQYMSPMGIGVGTEMGMNHSAAPMSAALTGSALPTHGAPSMFVPKFPLQSFPMPNVPAPDSSAIQPSNLVDSFVNPQAESAPGMAKFPASADPYLQCFSGLQMPLQMPQDQPNLMSSARKQRTRRESENSKT